MARSVIKIDDMYTVDPLKDRQVEFFSQWNNYPAFLLHGYAGTGKSFISIYKALEDVLDAGTPYKQLIIIRSAVPSRDIGALPGTIEEKGLIYELPYTSLCDSLFPSPGAYSRLKEQKKISFVLSSFLNGVTYDDCVIVVDEIQNMNYQELYSVITRVGINSKIVFCGDYRQNHIKGQSGIDKFMRVLHNMRSVCSIEFTIDDIVRSDFVKEFLIAEGET